MSRSKATGGGSDPRPGVTDVFRRFPGLVGMAWALRARLSPEGRRRVRRIANSLLSVVGSIDGALLPTSSVGLTFDDGPDPAVTPRVLTMLRQRRLLATFFVLTDKAEQYPDLIGAMAAESHEVALHADRHDRLTALSIPEATRRISAARALLERLTGQPVLLFRPPFGAQSLSTYLVARWCGLKTVVWGPHAEDWIDSSPEEVAIRGLKHVKGGDILLLHDGLEIPAGQTVPTFDRVRAFELILDGLAARGLRPTTVGDLVRTAKPRRTAWFRP